MTFMTQQFWKITFLCAGVTALFLAGCSDATFSLTGNSSGGTASASPTVTSTTAPSSRFDMAGGCYVLRANDVYVERDGNLFIARGADESNAERFFMQATGLSRYLFYTFDQQFLTGESNAVNATTSPADGSDWTFTGDLNRFNAEVRGQSLVVGNGGVLTLGFQSATLSFEPAADCPAYPEMPTGIAADTFTGPAINDPVIGFAEIHAHMGQGSEMSDGSEDAGPSAGGVLYGQAVHRFGVTHAIADCAEAHGPNGTLSAENIILDQDPTSTHDTQGWPTFVDWPFQDSFLHQQHYWRWLERAWKAGLRVMVTHGTGIEALCNIAKATYGDKFSDCVDMSNGVDQVTYMYDVQNYIDAQNGGPGEGWFRVVTSPAEARAVIAEGKLAVMLGLEFSNMFFCRVTFNPDGSENRECDRASIDSEIDRVWDLGIRNIFPYHDIDSALGGTGIFSSILNYVGFSDTRAFWKTYPCPDGGEGPTYFYNAGAELESAQLTQFNDPVTQAIIAANNGLPPLLPIYPPGRQCNARQVTDLGAYAIDKMMKKGFVIHIDHAELASKQYLLDQGARTSPNYPMVSGHGAQGGLTVDQAVQMIRQGGLIYPALPHGADWAAFKERLEPVWTASNTTRELAIGYGADANGLRTLPGPRGAGSEPVTYPFTFFSGEDWGPQFAAAGIDEIEIEQLTIPGGRAWDINQDGMYHYGLVPDIVEEIRIEAGRDGLDAFYRSAEAYLQTWEQTLAASQDAQTLPSPP